VRHRWQPTVSAIHYSGAEQATLSPQVAEAIQTADAIIIGPSNPWLSVAPILAVNGMRGALLARDVPRVAVTPIIGGQAIKGPTAKIMHELNIPPSSEQVAAFYGDIINGFVYDQQDAAPSIAGLRVLSAQTLMRTDHDKIALAKTVLGWLEAWGSS
jgi:LPPG:FO 2-phospho-L-lactate transferase